MFFNYPGQKEIHPSLCLKKTCRFPRRSIVYPPWLTQPWYMFRIIHSRQTHTCKRFCARSECSRELSSSTLSVCADTAHSRRTPTCKSFGARSECSRELSLSTLTVCADTAHSRQTPTCKSFCARSECSRELSSPAYVWQKKNESQCYCL